MPFGAHSESSTSGELSFCVMSELPHMLWAIPYFLGEETYGMIKTQLIGQTDVDCQLGQAYHICFHLAELAHPL